MTPEKTPLDVAFGAIENEVLTVKADNPRAWDKGYAAAYAAYQNADIYAEGWGLTGKAVRKEIRKLYKGLTFPRK